MSDRLNEVCILFCVPFVSEFIHADCRFGGDIPGSPYPGATRCAATGGVGASTRRSGSRGLLCSSWRMISRNRCSSFSNADTWLSPGPRLIPSRVCTSSEMLRMLAFWGVANAAACGESPPAPETFFMTRSRRVWFHCLLLSLRWIAPPPSLSSRSKPSQPSRRASISARAVSNSFRVVWSSDEVWKYARSSSICHACDLSYDDNELKCAYETSTCSRIMAASGPVT
ncbi:hypothetical protein P152DRAFT_260457 [Eremomyces bilateralis CBS 781.70]|uniref:Uncharacterized protein n=1 Tax=Eremomyces bilateralis CBS 781.70 TaxID=1392243 RepID=A0A6G1FQG1_9PEZI|nr:uncharacterized protein P152DRAFT_260457 [Eremomyces bilateralis CBS 781.70]KAF1807968.1 hypothetical protein P152DRAFT_260457 [Eremomyces bilateralis CBS 781.70]